MNEECVVQHRITHHTFSEIFAQSIPVLIFMAIWRYILGYLVIKYVKARWESRNKEIPKLLADDKYKVNMSVLQQTYQEQLTQYEVQKYAKRRTAKHNHVHTQDCNHNHDNNQTHNRNHNHDHNHNHNGDCNKKHQNNHIIDNNSNTDNHNNNNNNKNDNNNNNKKNTDDEDCPKSNHIIHSNSNTNSYIRNGGFIPKLQNDKDLIPMLSQKLNLSPNDIVDYWRYLRKQDKIKKNLVKYNEEFWKCITMTCITIFGIYVMCHEEFFHDPRLLFKQYPQQESSLIQTYYRISLGYHGFRAIFQFVEPKRKDFWAMVVHHWVTVILILASWWTGVMQIGAIVMVCHDNADIFLPAAKIARYEKNALLTNMWFGCFLLCWLFSRIGLFSWKVVYPVLFQAHPTYTCHIYYYFFSALLCILLLLHFYWLRMILGVAYTALFVSKMISDNRSDSSDNDM